MENQAFGALKSRFLAADTDSKIDIYVEAEDLTQSQYKELLKMFPLKDLHRLEAALA
ncbi:MAG: hypothetical protein FWC92_09825 [Defluviitaleaceae bacterium]|nr:hypothetical protein [Defluviitaleaceae bacterium]